LSFPETYLSHRVLYLIQADDLTQLQKEKIWIYIYVIPVRKELEKYSYDLKKSIDNHDYDLNSFGLDVYAIRNFLIERLDFLKTTYETYSSFLIGTILYESKEKICLLRALYVAAFSVM